MDSSGVADYRSVVGYFAEAICKDLRLVSSYDVLYGDVPPKMKRLSQWCEDVNILSPNAIYDFVYVDQENFDVYTPQTFQQLLDSFTEYKTDTYD